MGRRRAIVLALLLVLAALLLWPEAPPGPTGAWMQGAGLQPRFETLAGHRVRFVRAGSGPAVVLIHGFGSSIFTWRDVLPALAKDRDVVALDLPGFGGSDQPADLAADLFPAVVTGLMERLGLARASLVGNSMGGAVAVQLATATPERVERLVLVDAAGYRMGAAQRPVLLRVVGSAPLAVVLERLPFRRRLVRTALRQVFHDDGLVSEERVEEYLAPFARPGALRAVRSLLRSREAQAGAFGDVVARVRVPTLIVWGREDAWIPVADADRFAAHIPGARKVVLDSCGHLPQEERPAELLQLLEEFLPRAAQP